MTSPAELQAIRERLNTKDEANYKHLYDAQALLALYDAQSDEVRRLREALAKYGHHVECDLILWRERAVKGVCSCGFNAALGSQP